MLRSMLVTVISALVLLSAAPLCNSLQHFKSTSLKLTPGRMTAVKQIQGLGQSALTLGNSHSQSNMFERSKTTLYSTIEPAVDPNALSARTTARKTGIVIFVLAVTDLGQLFLEFRLGVYSSE